MLSARNATVVAILKVASKNRPWILFFSCSEKSAVSENTQKKFILHILKWAFLMPGTSYKTRVCFNRLGMKRPGALVLKVNIQSASARTTELPSSWSLWSLSPLRGPVRRFRQLSTLLWSGFTTTITSPTTRSTFLKWSIISWRKSSSTTTTTTTSTEEDDNQADQANGEQASDGQHRPLRRRVHPAGVPALLSCPVDHQVDRLSPYFTLGSLLHAGFHVLLMVMLLTVVLDAPELLLGQLGPAQPRKVLLDLVLVVEAGHQRPAPGGVVQTFELVVVKVVLLGVVVHEAVKWR